MRRESNTITSTKDGYFAYNNVLNVNTASRPPLLVTIYISVHSRDVSVRSLSSVQSSEFSFLMERGYFDRLLLESGTVRIQLISIDCFWNPVLLYEFNKQNPRLRMDPARMHVVL